MDDIKLEYSQTPQDPPWLSVIGQIATSVLSAIAAGLIEAGKTAGRELLSLATTERLLGALTEYFRESAGSWATKTILDASNQEWLTSILHAFGLDIEDLMEVTKNSLDRGFDVASTNIVNTLSANALLNKDVFTAIATVVGLHKDSTSAALQESAQITKDILATHAELTSKAFSDSIEYQTLNIKEQEAINRRNLRAIFTDTEDKIRARSKYSTEEQVRITTDTSLDQFDKEVPGIIKDIGKRVRPVQDFLNEIALSVRSSVYTLLVPRLPVSYEHVGVTAMSALGTAMGLGFSAHAVAVAADLLHPLKRTGLPQLAAFLADMAGFAAIARATWFEDMKNFLGTPYKHYSLKYFRPTLPREMDLQIMAVKPDIRMEDFKRGMQYWGYNDSWVNAIKRTMFKEPRYFELSMMFEDAHADLSWLYKKARRAGYNEDDSDIFVRSLLSKVLRPYISSYRFALQKLFTQGYITEEQFDTQLEALKLRSEANALLKKTAQFDFIETFTTDSIKLYTDMYDRDLITEDDFEVSLSSLGLRIETLTLTMNRAKVKKEAKVAREEKKEVKSAIRKRQALLIRYYTLLYRSGAIDENAFESALVFANVEPTVATITVQLEQQKKILLEKKKAIHTIETEQTKIKKKYEAGYISLFKKDVIDSVTLKEYLLGLDLEEDYVTAIVQTEVLKKYQPEPVTLS